MASKANLAGGRFAAIEKGKTVLAVGPGLGQDPETQEFIRTIVKGARYLIILDADGLNAFGGRATSCAIGRANFWRLRRIRERWRGCWVAR